ncbi:hypothetical protein VRZ08_04120 [Rhodopseudomonas sp. G2_2311]|uniref:hypothetical protein n=1 Tax=Rhodopseudomonas sp. G2_2311 TaxID=3114287 RepID=UPI0039C6E5EE
MSIDELSSRVDALTKRLALLEDRAAAASVVSCVAVGFLIAGMNVSPRDVIRALRSTKAIVSAVDESETADPDVALRQLRIEQFIQDEIDLIEQQINAYGS